MKLFIWNDPVSIRYGGSCLYIVAPDEETARKIAAAGVARASHGYVIEADDFESLKRLGKPDRVLDAPCGELYAHQE